MRATSPLAAIIGLFSATSYADCFRSGRLHRNHQLTCAPNTPEANLTGVWRSLGSPNFFIVTLFDVETERLRGTAFRFRFGGLFPVGPFASDLLLRCISSVELFEFVKSKRTHVDRQPNRLHRGGKDGAQLLCEQRDSVSGYSFQFRAGTGLFERYNV